MHEVTRCKQALRYFTKTCMDSMIRNEDWLKFSICEADSQKVEKKSIESFSMQVLIFTPVIF